MGKDRKRYQRQGNKIQNDTLFNRQRRQDTWVREGNIRTNEQIRDKRRHDKIKAMGIRAANVAFPPTLIFFMTKRINGRQSYHQFSFHYNGAFFLLGQLGLMVAYNDYFSFLSLLFRQPLKISNNSIKNAFNY